MAKSSAFLRRIADVIFAKNVYSRYVETGNNGPGASEVGAKGDAPIPKRAARLRGSMYRKAMFMPTYKPATTDEERLTLLRTAVREIERVRPQNRLRISHGTADWVEELTPRLAESDRELFVLKMRRRTAVAQLDEAINELRSHVRFVWWMLRRSARGREDADKLYTAFGLSPEGRVPKGNARADWLKRALQILESNERLHRDGYEWVSHYMEDLRQNYEKAAEAFDAAEKLKEPYQAARRNYSQLRKEAIALCQRIVTELRYELHDEKPPRARSIMRSYGIVFTPAPRKPKPKTDAPQKGRRKRRTRRRRRA